MRAVLALAAALSLTACLPWDRKDVDLGDLKHQLCDPGSAQVRNLIVRPGEVVAGEVNARTPEGGFAGYRWFVVDHGRASIVATVEDWPALCPPINEIALPPAI